MFRVPDWDYLPFFSSVWCKVLVVVSFNLTSPFTFYLEFWIGPKLLKIYTQTACWYYYCENNVCECVYVCVTERERERESVE